MRSPVEKQAAFFPDLQVWLFYDLPRKTGRFFGVIVKQQFDPFYDLFYARRVANTPIIDFCFTRFTFCFTAFYGASPACFTVLLPLYKGE